MSKLPANKGFYPLQDNRFQSREQEKKDMKPLGNANDIIMRLSIGLEQRKLADKINDPKFPFGHGYIVSCIIADIDITKFLN